MPNFSNSHHYPTKFIFLILFIFLYCKHYYITTTLFFSPNVTINFTNKFILSKINISGNSGTFYLLFSFFSNNNLRCKVAFKCWTLLWSIISNEQVFIAILLLLCLNTCIEYFFFLHFNSYLSLPSWIVWQILF